MKNLKTNHNGASQWFMLLAFAWLLAQTGFAQDQGNADHDVVYITMTRGEPESDIETAQPVFNDETGTYFTGRTVAETTLKPGADMALHNCDFIVIGGDFKTEPGASLRVFIDPCEDSGANTGAAADESKSEALTSIRDLKVYPNPFTDRTRISFSIDHDAEAIVSLTDITGREMSAANHSYHAVAGLNTLTVQGESLSAGIYLLNVRLDGENFTTKIIKSK